MREENLGINEWRGVEGGGAEGDDGTGTSQPCPKGKIQQDRWEGKSATSSGDNSPWSYFLIGEKQINGSFTLFFFPAQIIPAATSQPVLIPWCQFHGTGPQTPPDSQPGFPPASCWQGKAKAQTRRDAAPAHPLLSSLCLEGLHPPSQTRVEISSPKIPNLAWSRAHQQEGSTQAFPLPSSSNRSWAKKL